MKENANSNYNNWKIKDGDYVRMNDEINMNYGKRIRRTKFSESAAMVLGSCVILATLIYAIVMLSKI